MPLLIPPRRIPRISLIFPIPSPSHFPIFPPFSFLLLPSPQIPFSTEGPSIWWFIEWVISSIGRFVFLNFFVEFFSAGCPAAGQVGRRHESGCAWFFYLYSWPNARFFIYIGCWHYAWRPVSERFFLN